MNSDSRRYTRIYHKDLKDYKVIFRLPDDIYQGSLGNISDGGLCAILPKSFSTNRGELLKGYLLYVPYDEKYEFQGRVAWTSDYSMGGTMHTMIGLEFSGSVYLPEHLMALAMSLE